jgi:hypothetical protein
MTSDETPPAETEDIQTTGRVVQRRRRPSLSAYLPVRFPPDVLEDAKVLARHDGVSISSWVRNLVTREVMRRRIASETRLGFRIEVSSNQEQPASETEVASENPTVRFSDRYAVA